MKIGYARVSTTDQNLELQLTALKEAGCNRIYQEKISGAKKDRPELERLLDQLRPDDMVVVWKLDRLARSTQNLLELVEQIRIAEASFCSLSEPWADTTSHAGKMILTVFAGIAEFLARVFRSVIREIAQEGIAGTERQETQRDALDTAASRKNTVENFVSGAVATDGKKSPVALIVGLARQLHRVPGTRRGNDVDLQSFFAQSRESRPS